MGGPDISSHVHGLYAHTLISLWIRHISGLALTVPEAVFVPVVDTTLNINLGPDNTI
jgi:hypothetical protein